MTDKERIENLEMENKMLRNRIGILQDACRIFIDEMCKFKQELDELKGVKK